MVELLTPMEAINNVRGELIGPDGKIKEVREASNLIVNVGLNRAIFRILC